MPSSNEALKSYQERRRDLEVYGREVRARGAREVAILERQLSAARQSVEDQLAAAESREVELLEQLNDALAADFHAELSELVAAWREEPSRKLAASISDAFNRFDQRAMRELGQPLWDSAIAVAFAVPVVAAKPSAVNAFGNEPHGLVEVAGEVRRACATGAAPQVQAALERLEGLIEATAGTASGEVVEQNAARFALKKTAATHSHASRKLSPSYAARRRPEPLHMRALRAIGL